VPSSAGHDARRVRLRFFLRSEGALFVEPPVAAEEGLSAPARAVYELLKTEGASFASELQAAAGLRPGALNSALSELALGGLVTHDSLEPLRGFLAGEAASEPEPAPASALEADLAQRLEAFQKRRPLSPSRLREAKRRVTNRLRNDTRLQIEAAFAPAPAVAASRMAPGGPAGRWSLVHRAGVLGAPASDEARAERLARILLARYGMVSRESLEREAGAWEWSQLYRVYQQLELRGEVRRGYFVLGLSGIQYALPQAVEDLRASAASDGSLVLLNATDPANILGGEYPNTDAPRFSRLPSTHVALLCGRAVALFEEGGARITVFDGAAPAAVSRAVAAYLARRFAPRRVVVARWNDESILGSPGEPLLRALGFQSTPSAMEWWAGH